MNNLRIYSLTMAALGILTGSCLAQSPSRLSFDFNAANPWPHAASYASAKTVATTLKWAAVGSYDTAGAKEQSRAILLTADAADTATHAAPAWLAGFSSGLLAVQPGETDLGKLTLSFDLSASQGRPVTVKVASYTAKGVRSGALETSVYPAAPDFVQHFSLDLSSMKPSGAGKFSPIAPELQISFAISGETWPHGKHEVRVDNVNFSGPAFYVGPQGSDQNDGRSEKTAFATPQKAIDVAGPGDIILVMDGTYQPVDVQGGIAAFKHGGTPAAWITLKNYPNHHPLFFVTNTWAGVRIGRPKTAQPTGAPALPTLCYIEVRGLHIRGEGDVAKVKYPDLINKADPHTNSNGIMVDGGNEINTPHHLRFADNIVEFCPGAGIGAGSADWVTTENNIVHNNCWWMIYAGSGVSYLGTANFDSADNIYKDLIRNNVVSGNRCYVPWRQIGKMSDGNGIIIDTNYVPAQNKSHAGRTLIQSNLSFNNGGSGIHSFKSHRVDIINNTAYFNGATPELRWGQIFLQRTDDARIINNILVSRDDQPVNTVSKDSTDKENTNVLRANNIYFGGNTPPLKGTNDILADPQFVSAATDSTLADFYLKPSSPAIGQGRTELFSPFLDLDGKPRGAAPDVGACQH